MASRGIKIGLVLALAIMLWTGGAKAQSGCTNVLLGMASRLNYGTGSSSSTPSSSCCSQLANVVQSQPQFLCTVFNGGGSSLGININKTLALALPSACHVETPPVSKCDANKPATSPVGSPKSTPPESSNETPVSPTSSSVSGSKTVPSSGTTSDGSTLKRRTQFVSILVFMASFASIFSCNF